MKQMKFFSLFFMALALGFAACNNDNATETTDATTTTSSGDYAAMADEFQQRSDAGLYRDVRTGQPIRISVDRNTGAKLNEATNEPVTRYIYIDNNEWWVYDHEGNRLGRARLDNNVLLFETEDNRWVDYDTKWKVDGDETKFKSGDTKIKTDGDETKIKTNDQKIKVEDGETKVKND